MKNIKLRDKIALVLLVAMLVTNPLTGQFIQQGVVWSFDQLFLQGAWISLIAAVYLIALMAFYGHQSGKPKLPSKSK